MKKIYKILVVLLFVVPIVSVGATTKVSCGPIDNIPRKIPELTNLAVTIIEIAVPVILVIMGSLDLMKGVIASKEDEIKKGQQIFVKRLIAGVLVFLVIVIVKTVIGFVSTSDRDSIMSCVDCFISDVNSCKG